MPATAITASGLAPSNGDSTAKVTDLPLGSAKASDATVGTSTSEKKLVETSSIDLLTGPAINTQIGV